MLHKGRKTNLIRLQPADIEEVTADNHLLEDLGRQEANLLYEIGKLRRLRAAVIDKTQRLLKERGIDPTKNITWDDHGIVTYVAESDIVLRDRTVAPAGRES